MATIHEGQGNWYLDLETEDSDLGTATDTKILYKKPDGTAGSFTATVVGTKLRYVFSDITAPDEIRKWRFQAYYKIGGRTSKGKEATMAIYEALD